MKKDFFLSLFDLLELNQPILLATIISQHGSSPRGTGARMALTANRQQIGTIGGGRLEAILQDRFNEFITSKSSTILEFTLSESEAANLDMICGGSISLLVDPLMPDHTEIESLYKMIGSQQQGWIFTLLPEKDTRQLPQKCFVTPDGNIFGAWLPRIELVNRIPGWIKSETFEIGLDQVDLKNPQILTCDQARVFFEPIGHHSTVYIIGAGHIAQMLAPLTSLVGFRTCVLDDRPDYISIERFPAIDDLYLLENFEHVFRDLKIDSQAYVVIITRGHQFDKSVLKQALQTNAGYIGMIGSRRKIKLTFEALLKEEISEKQLKTVHSPIGLNIGAETPEEIAISIVAELIQIRANNG
ncbi:MAG: XdhC family protein [Anaerolineaceae bacterium]|nr:XdhC family protein [Anaerolineaceae bacterium]